jgi:hypothetical protein
MRRWFLIYAAVVPTILLAAHLLLGGPAVLVTAIAAILVAAARLDNHTGSCLLVTIVTLVMVGILLSLLMLVAKMGAH